MLKLKGFTLNFVLMVSASVSRTPPHPEEHLPMKKQTDGELVVQGFYCSIVNYRVLIPAVFFVYMEIFLGISKFLFIPQ